MDEDIYIKILYEKALEALNNNEIPVSALVIDSKGNIISVARNNRQETKSVIGHAEILAILEAEKQIKDWRLDGYSMIVSLFPCKMCQEVIRESRLDQVFYLLDAPQEEKHVSNLKKMETTSLKKFSDLLTIFFDNMR